MATPETQVNYLDESNIEHLCIALLTKVNTRINDRIVQDIDATSDANHIASAKAIYDLLQAHPRMKTATVIGPITSVVTPKTNYIYLQKDDEADPTWVMYIWIENEADGTGKWIVIGDTSIDLVNYWAKTEITELKEALGWDEVVMKSDLATLTEEQIDNAVNTAFAATDPFATPEESEPEDPETPETPESPSTPEIGEGSSED